jgi:hypothetical protein
MLVLTFGGSKSQTNCNWREGLRIERGGKSGPAHIWALTRRARDGAGGTAARICRRGQSEGRFPGVAERVASLRFEAVELLDGAAAFAPGLVAEEGGKGVALVEKAAEALFDRMLIAQALMGGLVIVTPDRAFEAYPVRMMW